MSGPPTEHLEPDGHVWARWPMCVVHENRSKDATKPAPLCLTETPYPIDRHPLISHEHHFANCQDGLAMPLIERVSFRLRINALPLIVKSMYVIGVSFEVYKLPDRHLQTRIY